MDVAFIKLESVYRKNIARNFLRFWALLENRQTQNLKELDEEIFGFSESLDFQEDLSQPSEYSQNQDYSIFDEEDMIDQKQRMKKKMTKANLLYEQNRNNEMIEQFENLKSAAEKKQRFLNVINNEEQQSQHSDEEMLDVSHMPQNYSRILSKDDIRKQVHFQEENNTENVLGGTMTRPLKGQKNLNSTLPKNTKLGALAKPKKKNNVKTKNGNLNIPVFGVSDNKPKKFQQKYKPVKKPMQQKPQMDHSFQLSKDDKKNMINRTFIDGNKNDSQKKINPKNQEESFDEIVPQFQNNQQSISDVQQSQEFTGPILYNNIFSFRQPVTNIEKKESLQQNEVIEEEKKSEVSIEESFEQKISKNIEKLSDYQTNGNSKKEELSISEKSPKEKTTQIEKKVQIIEQQKPDNIVQKQKTQKNINQVQTLNMFSKLKQTPKQNLQLQPVYNDGNFSYKKQNQVESLKMFENKKYQDKEQQNQQDSKLSIYSNSQSKKSIRNFVQRQKTRDITLSFSLIQIKTTDTENQLIELNLKKTFENFEIYLQKKLVQIKRKTLFVMQLYDPLTKRANFLDQILIIDSIYFKQKVYAYQEIQKHIQVQNKFRHFVQKKYKKAFLVQLHKNLVTDQILFVNLKKGFLKLIRLIERQKFLNIQQSYVNLKLSRKKSKEKSLTADKNFVFLKKKTQQVEKIESGGNKVIEDQMKGVFTMIEKILQNQNQNQQKILEELISVIKSSQQKNENKDLQKVIELLQNQKQQNQQLQTQSDNTQNLQFQEILQFLHSKQYSQNNESNQSEQSSNDDFDYQNFAFTFKLFMTKKFRLQKHSCFDQIYNFTQKHNLQDQALSIYNSYKKNKKNQQSYKSLTQSYTKNSIENLQNDHNNLLYISLEEEYMLKFNQMSNKKKILPFNQQSQLFIYRLKKQKIVIYIKAIFSCNLSYYIVYLNSCIIVQSSTLFKQFQLFCYLFFLKKHNFLGFSKKSLEENFKLRFKQFFKRCSIFEVSSLGC